MEDVNSRSNEKSYNEAAAVIVREILFIAEPGHIVLELIEEGKRSEGERRQKIEKKK